jgi:hypothetical protein
MRRARRQLPALAEKAEAPRVDHGRRTLRHVAAAVLALARRAGGISWVVAVLQLSGCGFDCDDVPVRATSIKEDASRCGAGDTCVVFSGGAACTGSLACPFPVNKAREAEVAAEVSELADEAEDCDDCGQPFCAAGGNVACDTRVGSCVFVP